jgi:hypothetical protein
MDPAAVATEMREGVENLLIKAPRVGAVLLQRIFLQLGNPAGPKTPAHLEAVLLQRLLENHPRVLEDALAISRLVQEGLPSARAEADARRTRVVG